MTEKRSRVHNSDPFFSVRDAAEYYNVSHEVIYDRVRRGVLEANRIGRRCIRIRKSALEAWLTWENSFHQRHPRRRAL